MPSPQILSIRNLRVGYKKSIVIDGISFDVKAGTVVGLAGLNGQGKTTLIKSILGLKNTLEGTINLGSDVGHMSYLPERFTPPALLTGQEFIKFSLKLFKQKIEPEKLIDMAQKISLSEEDLGRPIKTYSKGMRQKIGLLATFLADVPFIILDEPMSGLDPLGRKQVKRFIQQARSNGQAVFMTSHVLSDFSELCDEMLIFHDKKIRYAGTPSQLLENVQTTDIEEAFLGVLSSKAA